MMLVIFCGRKSADCWEKKNDDDKIRGVVDDAVGRKRVNCQDSTLRNS